LEEIKFGNANKILVRRRERRKKRLEDRGPDLRYFELGLNKLREQECGSDLSASG
jgi:hypothetical protein